MLGTLKFVEGVSVENCVDDVCGTNAVVITVGIVCPGIVVKTISEASALWFAERSDADGSSLALLPVRSLNSAERELDVCPGSFGPFPQAAKQTATARIRITAITFFKKITS